MKNVHLIYYSPSLTTRKVMRAIGKGMNVPVREYDITEGLEGSLSFDEEDLVVFGVPVYSSRVPGQMQHMLQWIKGNKTPSVLVCVYGNRDYDEALMELRDITSANGFSPIAAATFIAQHSIFPKMGANRPDEKDLEIINEFGKECYQRYLSYNPENEYQINVKGSYPLKEPSGSPFAPTGNDDCDDCGTCINHCPVQAIPASDPTTTNVAVCIRCGRCIALCPEDARAYRGEMYETIRIKFEGAFAGIRKEPEIIYPE